jgi:hypothetical protein
VDGFLTAAPETALVDALMNNGKDDIWLPDPSDIDLPSDVDPDEVVAKVLAAAAALGADIDAIKEFVSEIDGLEDRLPTP